jgi:hypothetical protein
LQAREKTVLGYVQAADAIVTAYEVILPSSDGVIGRVVSGIVASLLASLKMVVP